MATSALLPRPAMLRAVTDRAVIRELVRNGPASRADLSRATGISRPTMSTAVDRLAEARLIEPSGTRSGSRGRSATLYRIATSAGWVLALDIRHEGVSVVGADLAGDVWYRAVHDEPAAHAAAARRRSRGASRRALRSAVGRGPLRAVAVAAANPVDPRDGRLLPLAWSAFPDGVDDPACLLADLPGVPVLADNGVTLAARAERASGAAVGVDDLAYVYVGSGIGMGLVLGGRTVRGAHGLAGEVGYLTTGESGSLAPLVTEIAGGRARRERNGAPGSVPAIDLPGTVALLARADAGDRRSQSAVRALGRAVGRVIADTCAVVDPAMVLLGGPLGSHPRVVDAARVTVREVSPHPVLIGAGALPDAGVRGAMAWALEVAIDGFLGTS